MKFRLSTDEFKSNNTMRVQELNWEFCGFEFILFDLFAAMENTIYQFSLV